MFKTIAVSSLCLALSASALLADITTVNFDSGGFTLKNFDNVTLLTGGTAADGNGAVLQLGYFTGIPFTSTWVPLTGSGGANSAFSTTSIGDTTANGAGDGSFAMNLSFTLGSATSGVSLPANLTQLAIRFFNNTTIAGSTFYNTVTDATWLWKTPATPPASVDISLADAGLIWEGGVNSAFHTTIAIPEPSVLALVGLGLGLLPVAWARRRSHS
jgi:hypothetical protein